MQKEETGPLELQIEGLRKQILDSVDECNKLQQFWLRDQNNLVKQTKELDSLRHTISTLEKTLLIMDQKKLRIDGTQSVRYHYRRMAFSYTLV